VCVGRIGSWIRSTLRPPDTAVVLSLGCGCDRRPVVRLSRGFFHLRTGAIRPLPTLVVQLPPMLERTLRLVCSTVGLVGFLTVIMAGLVGDQNPMRNLAPVAVWIVGWVGFSFLSAVLGPVWRVLNPWATLYRCSRWMRSRLARRKGERRRVAPTWLGV